MGSRVPRALLLAWWITADAPLPPFLPSLPALPAQIQGDRVPGARASICTSSNPLAMACGDYQVITTTALHRR